MQVIDALESDPSKTSPYGNVSPKIQCFRNACLQSYRINLVFMKSSMKRLLALKYVSPGGYIEEKQYEGLHRGCDLYK